MPSSDRTTITLDAKMHGEFQLPEIVHTVSHSKDSTVFMLPTKDAGLCIVGTFDEILEFAGNIVSAIYSWPITTGHEEWLGTPVTPETEGANVYVIHRRNQDGHGEDRGAGHEASGDGSDVA